MDYPEPHKRMNAVCMKNILAAICAHEKRQLDIRLGKRSMAVGLMADKKSEVINELQHWHNNKKSFHIR
eukprot:1764659-Ditylum_brightwellii.AAC.1